MKKFDLNAVEVSNLSLDEINELEKYLKTVPVRVYVNFILHVMDMEYYLYSDNEKNNKVQRFIFETKSEYIFDIDTIMQLSNFEMSDFDWLQIEREHKTKQRKEKLLNITQNEEV
jgi:hypothetical protein